MTILAINPRTETHVASPPRQRTNPVAPIAARHLRKSAARPTAASDIRAQPQSLSHQSATERRP